MLARLSFVFMSLIVSASAYAFEPLQAIERGDEDYAYYLSVINMDQRLIDKGVITESAEINHFNIRGRIVPLRDGSIVNPLNLILMVNGNLYYVDSIMNRVDSFKIRRRWRNNPEPGVFLRIAGSRHNPETDADEAVQLWIKVSTNEGRALPVLKLFEGNFDL